ncbi:hypothetical protein DRJ17_00140 [Candidatus Woesearchaeota archaeon]|nr:MAG: hypothetical protein DRJ17_00140 [Candidatus Woesearchaeota archaeon]
MRSQKIDLDKIMKDGEKKRQKEIEDLESRSKPLSELIVTENFSVDEVVSESYVTSFTPYSEMVFGGKPPVYKGGFTLRLLLRVSPENPDIPIRTLIFDGVSVVRVGDCISAKIPKYEKKRIYSGFHSGPCDRDRVFYLDRDFNPEESAIELALISADGKVLRRDRAINYKNFVND